MIDPTVIMSHRAAAETDIAVSEIKPDKIFVLYDTTTLDLCAPMNLSQAYGRHSATAERRDILC